MSKAILGAAEIAAAVGMAALVPGGAGFSMVYLLGTTAGHVVSGIALAGLGTELGALSDKLKSGPGTTVVTRQSAAPQQIIYGTTRVDGSLVFQSTTGGKHGQLNRVLVWCSHQVEEIVAIYLDGKKIYFDGALGSNWGHADGSDHLDYAGITYNFGGGTKNYVEHRYGYPGQLKRDNSGVDAPTNYISGLTANDAKWGSSCNLFGHTYSYLKNTYDTNIFTGAPVAKAIIRGKNNIYDPRTDTRGFTSNAALVIADYLTSGRLGDTVRWGWRFSWDDIDLDELIASANVCDEDVALAAGGTEKRYTVNGNFLTDGDPGSVLQSMLDACAGSIIESGGKLKILVGYDRGVSLAFDEGDMTGSIQWSSRQSYRDLFNRVGGTFISPRYPYNAAGDGTSADVPQPGIFDGMWQATQFPPFFLSSARGYSYYPLYDPEGNPVMEGDGVTQRLSDVFMADDCERLDTELKLQFVTSAGQAQRLGKIKLMRHRQQGAGTIPLKMCGLSIQGKDNVLISFPPHGWINKEMEVVEWREVPKEGEGGAPLTEYEIDVKETDPDSEYAWSTDEELAINAVTEYPGIEGSSSATLELPTSVVLTSGSTTAITTSDGVVHPRIRVTWTRPTDEYIQYIDSRYTADGGATWHQGPDVTVDIEELYITNVIQGHAYSVQLRSVSSRGSLSAAVTAGPHTVSTLQSVITSAAMVPASPVNQDNDATIDAYVDNDYIAAHPTFDHNVSIVIRAYGPGGVGTSFTRKVGYASVTMPPLAGGYFVVNSTYFIVYDISTGFYLVKDNWLDTLQDNYVHVGAVQTPALDGTGGFNGGGGVSPGGGLQPNLVAA